MGVLGLTLIVSALPISSWTAQLASDSAQEAVYDKGWATDGANGGKGWMPWVFCRSDQDGSHAGFFLGDDSPTGPNGNIGIASPNHKGWGMYANNGALVEAFRFFTIGGSNEAPSLAVGQALSLDMRHNQVDAGGMVGIALQSGTEQNDNGTLVYFLDRYESGNYIINVIGGEEIDTGVPTSSDTVHLNFARIGDKLLRIEITPRGEKTSAFNVTLQPGEITKIRLFNSNAGPGSSHDLFFNNLSVGVAQNNMATTGSDAAQSGDTMSSEPRETGSGSAASLSTAPARQTAVEWQREATKAYPALAKKDSDLNRLFVSEYSRLKRDNPAFFSIPQWPMVLARQCADKLKPAETAEASPAAGGPALSPEPDKPRQITVECSLVELPSAMADAIESILLGGILNPPEQARRVDAILNGAGVKKIATVSGTTVSGERVFAAKVTKDVYSVGGSRESRNIGDTFEVEPTVGADNFTCDLNCVFSRTKKANAPYQFETIRPTTSVTTFNGLPVVLARRDFGSAAELVIAKATWGDPATAQPAPGSFIPLIVDVRARVVSVSPSFASEADKIKGDPKALAEWLKKRGTTQAMISVTTKSGQRAVFQHVFEECLLQRSGSFETYNLGAEIEAEPRVLADNHTVELNAKIKCYQPKDPDDLIENPIARRYIHTNDPQGLNTLRIATGESTAIPCYEFKDIPSRAVPEGLRKDVLADDVFIVFEPLLSDHAVASANASGAVTPQTPQHAHSGLSPRVSAPALAAPISGKHPWEADYATALAKAKAEKRPIFLLYANPGDDFVPEVGDALKEFVWVRWFYEENRPLPAKLPENGLPAYYFINSETESMLARTLGSTTVNRFMRDVTKARAAAALPLTKEMQDFLAFGFDPDFRVINEMSGAGDTAGLIAYLKPLEKDHFRADDYLVLHLHYPPGVSQADVVCIVIRRDLIVPKSGVFVGSVAVDSRPGKKSNAHITLVASGCREIQDDVSFDPEIAVLAKEYTLEPLRQAEAASFEGQVFSGNGHPAANAIVRICDWGAVTRTDSAGHFQISGISPGSFLVRAEAPAGEFQANLAFEPGKTLQQNLTLNPVPTIGIRWVLQTKEGSRNLTGEGTRSGEAYFSLGHSRFILERGAETREAWGSDFMLRNCSDDLRQYFSASAKPEMQEINPGDPIFWLFDGGRHAGLHRENARFEDIKEVNDGKPFDENHYWEFLRGYPVRAGDVFTLRCVRRDCYAKMEITDVTEVPKTP